MGPFNLTTKKLLPKCVVNLLDTKFDDFSRKKDQMCIDSKFDVFLNERS